MRHFFFVTITLLFSIIHNYYASNPTQAIQVKYSNKDCYTCNIKLQSIIISAPYTVNLILLDSSSLNDDFYAMVKPLPSSKYSIKVSGTEYFNFDSGHRTKIFLLNNGKKIFESFVVDFDPKDYSQYSNIDVKSLSRIRDDKNYLYLLSTNDYILTVKKDNLYSVHDTVWINKSLIKAEIFHSLFGTNYRLKIDTLNHIAALAKIPDNFQIRDFEINNDTIILLTQINYPIQTNSERIMVKRIPSIIRIHNDRILSADILDYSMFTYDNPNAKYYIETSSFEYFNNDFYFNIRKDSLTDKNYFFASTKKKQDRISYKKIIHYPIPYCLVESNTGYFMSRSILSDGLLSNVYSDTLYDLSTNNTLKLNISHKNHINKEDALNLAPKLDFIVLGLSKVNDTLHTLFMLNEEIWHNSYIVNNTQNVKKINSVKITELIKGTNPFSIITNQSGFYSYNSHKKQFHYFDYKILTNN